jgi:hypothetical protein
MIRKSRKAQEIPLNHDGKPRWTQEKEAQLRQYINQYGPDAEMAKELFPLFEKADLAKRIKKIVQNKDDSIKAKIRNLIKKGSQLQDIIKLLSEVPTLKVKKFYDKIIFNMEKREKVADPELFNRVLTKAAQDESVNKSTDADDQTYDEIALEEEEALDGFFKEDSNDITGNAAIAKDTPAKKSKYEEVDFAIETGCEDPYVFDCCDSYDQNKPCFDIFEMPNDDMSGFFCTQPENDCSILGERRISAGIFADMHKDENLSTNIGTANFDFGMDCDKLGDFDELYIRYD